MRMGYRLGLIILLVVGSVGLAIHYDISREQHWPHPDAEMLADDPDEFDGDTALLIGEVEAVDESASTIEYRPDEDVDLTLTATGVTEPVEPGGVVQVYGELDLTDETHAAEEIVVVNRDRSDQHYKLGMSGVGVIVAAGIFLWYWRIDWRTLAFRERHG